MVGSGGSAENGGVDGTGGTSASKCPAGWNLAWSDEFDGPAGTAANGNNWAYETGNNNGWGNNELEYYEAGNANGALDGNGNFVITSKKEAVGGFNVSAVRPPSFAGPCDEAHWGAWQMQLRGEDESENGEQAG
jgi:hypothetical protein